MGKRVAISSLFNIEKGSLQSSKCIPGEFTFITASEEWKNHNSYSHECEALIFAMAASGSLGRTHYVNEKFSASDLCFILTPKEGINIDLKFYYHVFNLLRVDIVRQLATGTSKLSINKSHFKQYKVPYLKFTYQHFFRVRIDNILSIKNELSNEFTSQTNYLSLLRQSILQDAFDGKLTEDWRKRKDLQECEETYMFDSFNLPNIPACWRWASIVEIVSKEKHSIKAGPFGSSLKKEFYVKDGYKIYGQEQAIKNDAFYGDYYIDEAKYRELESCKVKPFDVLISLVGTVGKLLILPENCQSGIINPRLVKITFNLNIYSPKLFKLYFSSPMLKSFYIELLQGSTMDVLNLGIIKSLPYLVPPLAEQHEIVRRVEKLLAIVDEMEKQVAERKEKAERLMQAVLREAFEENN